VRQELGRCRDAGVGERLMEAEGRLDGLVARLRARGVASVATLDSAFAQTDRLLAEHHWRLATWGLANPRATSRAQVGADVGAAATHFARGEQVGGRELDPEAARVVADARQLADVLASTAPIPSNASVVLDALGRRIVVPAVVAHR
jgi:hypothetical protein